MLCEMIQSIDGTAGIWVETKLAWHELKKPDDKAIVLSDGTLRSQENLHVHMRAMSGLMSMILEPGGWSQGGIICLGRTSIQWHSKGQAAGSLSTYRSRGGQFWHNVLSKNDVVNMHIKPLGPQ